MPKISAIINTRNEEQNIRYCLETLKWCDEIIVVDMESEDRTVKIAGEYTDKIYSHEQVLAFDIARKFAVGKATGEWILLIDADEMVPKILAEHLKDIADEDKADIVYIPFKTYIMGAWIRYTRWWPEHHPRFFKNGTIQFVETVHDFMKISKDSKKIYLAPEEKNAIFHFNYRDASHFIKKLNRYTTLESQYLFNEAKPFRVIRLFRDAVGEFLSRYIIAKGYRDGYRGFFLSVTMAFYRFLSHVKLWELYERQSGQYSDYTDIREKIAETYREDIQAGP